MTNFIVLFPLGELVYPKEALNLHIFEESSKQLIRDCIAEKKPFGIPPARHSSIQEYRTLMNIVELAREYDNGEMDVRTEGASIFRLLEPVVKIPEKLYGGAIVSYPKNVTNHEDSKLSRAVIEEVKRMYDLLGLQEKFPALDDAIISYKIAHFIGLTPQQEYELLCIFTEIQRLEYIRRHLNAVLPFIKEMEAMKRRVQLNGHFKHLSLDNL